MQKRRLSVKLISLLLTLSFLISAFSIFAFAEESDTDASATEMNVVYNRTFSEGWDYDNGILASFAKGNQIGLGYEFRNSAYNYFLKVVKQNTDVAYAHIDTTGLLPMSGKTFVEFDIASSLNNAMGQAIRISIQGDVKTLVEFNADGMSVLGTNVGRADYAMKWESISFEIDFDYGQNTDGASADEYLITAYFNNEKLASKVYSKGFGGFGVTQLRFAFGNVKEANIDSWYAIDNLQIYSGVDTFTAIKDGTYGTAIDANRDKDYTLAGSATHTDGYIRGEYDVNREEPDSRLLTVYYNRHFGEGWTLNQASSTMTTKYASVNERGNNVDIRSEKDFEGNYNYFMRFRALNSAESGFELKIPDCPDDEFIYIEFDLKTGVNTDLGGIMKLSGASDTWLLGIVDGQLQILGQSLGYIGSAWTHFAIAIDPEEMTLTVYYGDKGVYEGKLPASFNTVFFGQEGGSMYDSFGDWFGIDNLQIYSGIFAFAESLDPNDYGIAVDARATKDFVLNDASAPDTPVSPDGPGSAGGSSGKPTAPSGIDELLSGSPDLERVDIDDSVRVQYNRHYGEGWSFAVGGGQNSAAIMQLQSEQTIDLSFNYYQHYEVLGGGGNAYWTFSATGMPSTGKVYLEMDLRMSDGANFGGAWQMRANGGSNYYLIGAKDGYFTGYNGAKLGKIADGEWFHVAIEFDFDYAKNSPSASSKDVFLISYYYGDNKYAAYEHNCGGKFGLSGFRVGFETQSAANAGQFWDMDNLQFYAGTSTFANIPVDNYGTLINTSTPKDFPIQSGGTTIDDMIADSLFMKLNSEYTLNNNVRKPALENAEGKAYGAPLKINDKVWVPIDTILNYLSYPIYITEDEQSFAISTGASITYITLGRDTAVVAGEKVMLDEAPAVITDNNGNEYLAATIDDMAKLFPDFHIVIDDMNLITFTKHADLASGNVNESLRIDIMKDFLFNYIAAEDIYDQVKDYTNNFDHPYIIANQEKFDELAETYRLGKLNKDDNPLNDVEDVDMTLYSYINRIVNSAKYAYIDYASGYARSGGAYAEWVEKFDTGIAYEGLKAQCYIYDSESSSIGLRHPWPSSNGYDPNGGRLTVNYSGASTGSGSISSLGYAYQVTRDIRYAELAYDWASMLVDWDHWGPGHFLNAADAAAAVSTTYDWCYDAWVELGLNVDKIADGIYYHGALQGYLVSIGQADPHGRAGGNGSKYPTMVNNWNAVCTAGVACAAFSVMGYTGFNSATSELASSYARKQADTWGGERMNEVTTGVISKNFFTLVNTGIDIYAPDGSYEESVSYWAYGANNLFRYCSILESCLGTDLGLMDTWGLDRTAYSIAQMVSSDFVCFAYNDGSVGGSCDSGSFAYLAGAVNDDALRLIRKMHIEEGGFGVSMIDSLFYKPMPKDATVELPLQYHHIGIHGYTVRSSWDSGAIYAGLLGGDNDDGHGHIDAGQWIYYSHGISWIQDIGPDGYNTYKYFSNNHMYKTNPEGHNVICLTSMQDKVPAGQLRSSISPVLEVGDNEHGAYTIVDTLPAFSSAAMLSCQRGMLFTNDRRTVIIQDEITPKGNQSMYWFAHYNVSKGGNGKLPSIISDVQISSNGRTAFMYSKSSVTGEVECLRLSIVSPLSKGITFGIMTAAHEGHEEDFVLDATQRYGYSESMGKDRESDRSMWYKLFIKFENLYSVNVAVVVEVIDEENPLPIGYTWTPMYQWEPYADKRVKSDDDIGPVVDETLRGKAQESQIPTYSRNLNKRFEDGTLFEDVDYFYKAITNMKYVVDTLGRDRFEKDKYTEYMALYDQFLALYESYYDKVTTTASHIKGIRNALLGAKSETAPEESE